MQQKLPLKDFKWVENPEDFDLAERMYDIHTDDIGYFLEVDLEYPDHLHDSHNDFPLAPERVKITRDMLSPYARMLRDELDLSKLEVSGYTRRFIKLLYCYARRLSVKYNLIYFSDTEAGPQFQRQEGICGGHPQSCALSAARPGHHKDPPRASIHRGSFHAGLHRLQHGTAHQGHQQVREGSLQADEQQRVR